ncbi:MAG TPA: hypothetical protein DHW02_23035 [Ktedonobacter sp.]|nr:hypothetical protein [Ktedonobacter sp.]
MADYHAEATVNAPVHQVYTLFTHFNDFPKFMSFVKEVTYIDDQRSHWVAHVEGDFSWDAVNEDWIPDQQVGWRSIQGLENYGRVTFQQLTPQRTGVNVFMHVTPPAGKLGSIAEALGVGSRFEQELQNDLNHFARMVEQSPSNALDPMQSHYLFHTESAVAKGTATGQQQSSMQHDPMMSNEALTTRDTTIRQQAEQEQQRRQEQDTRQQQAAAEQEQASREQSAALQKQADIDAQTRREQAAQEQPSTPTEPNPVHDTIGGRNAAMPRNSFGDQDARGERFPGYTSDPMTGRAPEQIAQGGVIQQSQESPWDVSIHGRPEQLRKEDEQEQTESS